MLGQPVAETRITPLLKWPGGKSSELDAILPRLPGEIDTYFEPFVGGGAIFFSVSSSVPAFINDKSSDLIDFYKCVATANQDFFNALDNTQQAWTKIE